MPKSRRCCIFVLILGGLHLVTGYVSISGCSGESATLFRGITFSSENIVFNLYKNGDNNIELAMLSKQQNSDLVNVIYQNGYGKKLSLENGTIRIHNLSKSDEGRYILQPALGTLSMKIEVNLVVLVGPPKQCRPTVKREENTLVASLDIEDCGNSTAHVSWYKFGANNRSHPVNKLNYTWEMKGKTESLIVVGKEADTYCACAESSDMHCVGRVHLFDLCSCFNIEKDNILTTLPKQPEMTTWIKLSDMTERTTDIHDEWLKSPGLIIIIALSIISILAIVAAIVTPIILYRRGKVSSPSRNPELPEEKETLMNRTISSEVSSPSRNPELPEEKEMSMNIAIASEGAVYNTNGLKFTRSPRKRTISS